jgi:alanine-glyoxylate transaminase/serine-glyoxylate transaminase/serine-pyruvate transaminase
MGPGPSDVHPRILSAMARPTIGHLDPAFVGMMNETKEGLKTIFKTENELTILYLRVMFLQVRRIHAHLSVTA